MELQNRPCGESINCVIWMTFDEVSLCSTIKYNMGMISSQLPLSPHQSLPNPRVGHHVASCFSLRVRFKRTQFNSRLMFVDVFVFFSLWSKWSLSFFSFQNGNKWIEAEYTYTSISLVHYNLFNIWKGNVNQLARSRKEKERLKPCLHGTN